MPAGLAPPAGAAPLGREEVIARWLHALGGEGALRAIQGTYVWSRFTNGDLNGRSEEWSTGDGRFRSVTDFNSFKRITGFDGAHGFVVDENGKVQSLTGPSLDQLRAESYIAANAVFFPERVKGTAGYAGEGVVNGHLCHMVDLAADGSHAVRIYLDARTFLPAFARQFEDADTIWTFYTNYKPVDGVMEPFELRTVTSGRTDETRFTVEALQHLKQAPPAAFFAVPPDTLRDFAFDGGAGSAEIPFELWDDHVVVFARSHGVGPLPFLVDTGAEASDVDAAMARSWRMLDEVPLQIQGTGGTQSATLARLDTLSLPGITLVDQRVVALDLSGLRPAGRSLAGVLGYDFLSRFVLKFDFMHGMMTVLDPASAPESEGDVVPFNLDSFVPRVTAMVNDSIPAQFQVDTGAPTTAVFFRPFWQAHKLLSPRTAQRTVETAGVGGRATSTQARFAALSVGRLRVEGPLAYFRDNEAGATRSVDDAGLLGMAFWKRFDVTLDYGHRHLVLKPNRAFAGREECDMSGLILAAVDGRVMVVGVEAKSAGEVAGVKPGDFIAGPDLGISATDRVAALERALRAGDGKEVSVKLERSGRPFEAVVRLRKRL